MAKQWLSLFSATQNLIFSHCHEILMASWVQMTKIQLTLAQAKTTRKMKLNKPPPPPPQVNGKDSGGAQTLKELLEEWHCFGALQNRKAGYVSSRPSACLYFLHFHQWSPHSLLFLQVLRNVHAWMMLARGPGMRTPGCLYHPSLGA